MAKSILFDPFFTNRVITPGIMQKVQTRQMVYEMIQIILKGRNKAYKHFLKNACIQRFCYHLTEETKKEERFYLLWNDGNQDMVRDIMKQVYPETTRYDKGFEIVVHDLEVLMQEEGPYFLVNKEGKMTPMSTSSIFHIPIVLPASTFEILKKRLRLIGDQMKRAQTYQALFQITHPELADFYQKNQKKDPCLVRRIHHFYPSKNPPRTTPHMEQEIQEDYAYQEMQQGLYEEYGASVEEKILIGPDLQDEDNLMQKILEDHAALSRKSGKVEGIFLAQDILRCLEAGIRPHIPLSKNYGHEYKQAMEKNALKMENEKLWQTLWQVLGSFQKGLDHFLKLDAILTPKSELPTTAQQAKGHVFLEEETKHKKAKHYKLNHESLLNLYQATTLYKNQRSGMVGQSVVVPLPSRTDTKVYAKLEPEFGFYEKACVLWMHHLGLERCPLGQVGRIFDKESWGIFKTDLYYTSVYFSPAIQGERLDQSSFWKEEVRQTLDQDHTHRLILASLLVNPEDYKPDNFILQEEHFLIPIDNMRSFLPSATSPQKGMVHKVHLELMTKNLLFVLDEMQKPLSERLKKDLQARMKENRLVTLWVKDLQKVYSQLCEIDEKLGKDKKRNPLATPFYKDYPDTFAFRLMMLNQELAENEHVTPADLLNLMDPYLYKQYQRVWSKRWSLKKRFEDVCGNLYTMHQDGTYQSKQNTKMLYTHILTSFDREQKGQVEDIDKAVQRVASRIQEEHAMIKKLIHGTYPHEEEIKENTFFQRIGLFSSNEQKALETLARQTNWPAAIGLKGIRSNLTQLLSRVALKDGIAHHVQVLDVRGGTGVTNDLLSVLSQHFPSLAYLNVSNTSMTQVDLVEFPLKKLERLSVKGCQKLERLNLENSAYLRYLEVDAPSHLKQFNAKGTRITDKVILRLMEKMLSPLKKEEVLTSDKIVLRDRKEISVIFFQGIEFPNLQTLNLEYNNIGDQEVEYLSKANFPNLQTLDLRENNLGDKGAEHLARANFPNLQYLGLGDNNLGDKGAEHLSKANFPNLQKLALRSNNLGEKRAEIISHMKNFPNIQALYLLDNNLGEKGAEHLAQAHFPNLQTLDLHYNTICEKGAEHLAKANFPQLQELYLGDNNIGEKGAEHLSKANFPNLQELYLELNNLGEKGAEHLSKANFPNLQELYLELNNLGEKGAEHLAKANFPNLQELDLGRNNLGDKGVEHLAKANFPNLQELYLVLNNLGYQAKKDLQKLLKQAFPKALINI